MIQIKDLDVLNLDDKLREIVFAAMRNLDPVVITSAYRHGDAGCHGTQPLRAIDLRCHDELYGHSLAEVINDAWEYDHERLHKRVAIYHDVGQGAHLHLQSHPNTRRRGR